ncbi:MAG: hypothetical protein V7721_12360 [Porticoccaceae bacterium]
MMKIMWKLSLLGLLMALVFPFIIHGQGGEPVVTLKDMALDMESPIVNAKQKIEIVKQKFNGGEFFSNQQGEQVSNSTGLSVYRWRDSNGAWQFSDETNPHGDYETVVIEMNLESSGLTSSDDALPQLSDNNNDRANGLEALLKNVNKLPLPLTISSDDLEKMIKDSGGLQGLVEKYGERLDTPVSSNDRL